MLLLERAEVEPGPIGEVAFVECSVDMHSRVGMHGRERQVSERFDLVFFIGALCHLGYALLALDSLAPHAVRWLVFQSMLRGSDAIDR